MSTRADLIRQAMIEQEIEREARKRFERERAAEQAAKWFRQPPPEHVPSASEAASERWSRKQRGRRYLTTIIKETGFVPVRKYRGKPQWRAIDKQAKHELVRHKYGRDGHWTEWKETAPPSCAGAGAFQMERSFVPKR